MSIQKKTTGVALATAAGASLGAAVLTTSLTTAAYAAAATATRSATTLTTTRSATTLATDTLVPANIFSRGDRAATPSPVRDGGAGCREPRRALEP